MAYATLDELKNQITTAILISLTDEDQAGVINETKVAQTAENIDALINSYCRKRYAVPFTTVPNLIRSIAIDLYICDLYTNAELSEIPKDRKAKCVDSTALLENVRDGKLSLDTEVVTAATDAGPASLTTREDRDFTLGRVSDGTHGTLDNY